MIDSSEQEHVGVYFGGDYRTETEAHAHLHKLVERTGLFRVYREVEGFCIQPRTGTERMAVRADFILVPKQNLIRQGWISGLIGVEAKRTGEKVGKAISQCLDYSRSVFCLPDSGVEVMCKWWFLWRLRPLHGIPQSVCLQNRIGFLDYAEYRPPGYLDFSTGVSHPLIAHMDGTAEVAPALMGNKIGSR